MLQNLSMSEMAVDILDYAGSIKSELIIGVLALLITYIVISLLKRPKGNFPPGPYGLPIVGYFPFLSEDAFIDFIELGKKYGDVFSVQLGSERAVVLNGAEVIREAFAKPEFSGRPHRSTMEIVNKGSPFFSHDMEVWKEQRRFVVHSLKDLGLGKSKIESEVQSEIDVLIDSLRSHDGRPMNFKTPLSPSMSNNICAMIFGKRLNLDDPDRVHLDKNLDEALDTLSQTDMYTYFWWAPYIPFAQRLFKIDQSIQAYAKIRKFFRGEIEKHKQALDPNNVKDFIDICLVEIKARQKKDPHSKFSEPMLLSNVTDLFEAGSETVRQTLLWCIYIMAAFPDTQTKVQEEIRDVIGERKAESLDLKSVPYTHAVLLEIMRWKTLVPLNVLRYTLEDTTVGGYDVAKDTIIVANLWNAHHDTRYWTEPDVFRPERFLSEDGKTVIKSPNFMPFSLGRRACPGETMAYMLVFMYFASILQKFDVRFPEGTKPSYKAKTTLNHRKTPYDVRFISRQ